jgi:hypothetical protein
MNTGGYIQGHLQLEWNADMTLAEIQIETGVLLAGQIVMYFACIFIVNSNFILTAYVITPIHFTVVGCLTFSKHQSIPIKCLLIALQLTLLAFFMFSYYLQFWYKMQLFVAEVKKK